MIKKISIMACLQLMSSVLSAVTIPYYLKVIGVSNFGIMAVAIAVNQYFLLIVDYGFTLIAARKVTRNKNSREENSKLFNSILTFKLLTFFFGLSIIYAFLQNFSVDAKLSTSIEIGTIIVLGNLFTPTWLYLGRSCMQSLAVMTIIPRLLTLPIIFIYVKGDSDLFLALWLYCIPILVTGMLATFYAIYKKWIYFRFEQMIGGKSLLIESWPLFLSAFSTSFYTSFTPILINILAGPFSVGVFTSLEKIRAAFLSAVTPVSQVIFPKVNHLFAKSINEGFSLVRHISIYLIGGSTFIVIATMFFSDLIINFLFDQSIEGLSISLILFLVSVIANVINVIVGNYIYIPLGKSKSYANTIFTVGFMHLIILSILTHYYNFLGASICLLITEISISVMLLTKLGMTDEHSKKVFFRESLLYQLFNRN